jgi:hypothetical protein
MRWRFICSQRETTVTPAIDRAIEGLAAVLFKDRPALFTELQPSPTSSLGAVKVEEMRYRRPHTAESILFYENCDALAVSAKLIWNVAMRNKMTFQRARPTNEIEKAVHVLKSNAQFIETLLALQQAPHRKGIEVVQPAKCVQIRGANGLETPAVRQLRNRKPAGWG